MCDFDHALAKGHIAACLAGCLMKEIGQIVFIMYNLCRSVCPKPGEVTLPSNISPA